jgi:ADP-ribosyltransferase exoenzyme
MSIVLSPSEIELIRRFTEGFAIEINESLRHSFEESGSKIGQEIAVLDALIARTMIAAPFRLYRGIGADYGAALRAKKPKPGAPLIDAGFLCTSQSLTIARQSAYRDLGKQKGLVLAVNGTRPTNGIAIAPWSAFPEEKEVVLARNVLLTIIGYDARNSIIETQVHCG